MISPNTPVESEGDRIGSSCFASVSKVPRPHLPQVKRTCGYPNFRSCTGPVLPIEYPSDSHRFVLSRYGSDGARLPRGIPWARSELPRRASSSAFGPIRSDASRAVEPQPESGRVPTAEAPLYLLGDSARKSSADGADESGRPSVGPRAGPGDLRRAQALSNNSPINIVSMRGPSGLKTSKNVAVIETRQLGVVFVRSRLKPHGFGCLEGTTQYHSTEAVPSWPG